MTSSSSWWDSRGTFLVVALLCFCTLGALSDSVTDGTIDTESWLRQYGYLAPQDLSEAISDMQRFYKLEVTGQMDKPTFTAMKQPRCGVPDKTPNQILSKWDKLNITYSIENSAPNIAWYETFEATSRAFKVWEKVSPLTFEEIPYEEIHYNRRNKADIMISFTSGSNKDCGPFGRTVLAHAHYPGSGTGGDVHFNSDWQWSTTNQNVQGSINVFLVALHQLGHALGLGHSSNKSSVMYPSYHWMETEDFQLPADDGQEIQQVYREWCPSGWKWFEDKCYYRTTGSMKTWEKSRDYCLNQGADLVVINSKEEQDFINGLWTFSRSWMGLNRTGYGYGWTWVDGTPLTTQSWAIGELVAYYADRNCVYNAHMTGTWRNDLCSSYEHGICEK